MSASFTQPARSPRLLPLSPVALLHPIRLSPSPRSHPSAHACEHSLPVTAVLITLGLQTRPTPRVARARRGRAHAPSGGRCAVPFIGRALVRQGRPRPFVAVYVARPMSCCMLVHMHNVTITFVGQYLVRQAIRVPAGPLPDVESEEADSGIACARHATCNVSDATDDIQHDRSNMPYGARTRVEPHRKCVQQSDAAVAAVAGLGCAVVERRRVLGLLNMFGQRLLRFRRLFSTRSTSRCSKPRRCRRVNLTVTCCSRVSTAAPSFRRVPLRHCTPHTVPFGMISTRPFPCT